MVRKRPLTDEEKRLWEYITRHDVPLQLQADMSPAIEDHLPTQKTPKKIMVRPVPPVMPPLKNANAIPVSVGHYAGIDRNTAERFRKGDAPIDATLDLHGMTQMRAHQALVAFIHQHVRRGSRNLLVITGKGNRNAGQDMAERGILRESLPAWLAEPDISPFILACDVAKPKHGGMGAFYILLRRKRVSDDRG